MRSFTHHHGLALTGATTAVLLLAACGSSTSSGAAGGTGGTTGGTINIGVIGPMTGPAAEIGNLMSGACYAAALDVNKAGGVLGRKVSCDLVDDTGDPADAVPNVSKALATTSNLDMAVGLESNTAATTIPLVNNAHIPMVSTNGLVAYVKTHDTYFWRMTPSDDQNGAGRQRLTPPAVPLPAAGPAGRRGAGRRIRGPGAPVATPAPLLRARSGGAMLPG